MKCQPQKTKPKISDFSSRIADHTKNFKIKKGTHIHPNRWDMCTKGEYINELPTSLRKKTAT